MAISCMLYCVCFVTTQIAQYAFLYYAAEHKVRACVCVFIQFRSGVGMHAYVVDRIMDVTD